VWLDPLIPSPLLSSNVSTLAKRPREAPFEVIKMEAKRARMVKNSFFAILALFAFTLALSVQVELFTFILTRQPFAPNLKVNPTVTPTGGPGVP
jgi:hypothetical protein